MRAHGLLKNKKITALSEKWKNGLLQLGVLRLVTKELATLTRLPESQPTPISKEKLKTQNSYKSGEVSTEVKCHSIRNQMPLYFHPVIRPDP